MAKAQAGARRPTARACHAATKALAALHGMPQRPKTPSTNGDVRASCGETPTVLEALVRTILSQNTTNKNSSAAMASLRRAFNDDWQAMRRARPETIARAIACGGLANVKGRRIHTLLQDLYRQDADISLERLRHLPDAEAKEALQAIDGVGPKTASCVLLFCLGRDSFAVDTHVLRIAKRLGWLSPAVTREQAHHILDAAVPARYKYPLHVLMVAHGKCCIDCAAQQRPQKKPLGPCPLTPLLPSQNQAARSKLKKTLIDR